VIIVGWAAVPVDVDVAVIHVEVRYLPADSNSPRVLRNNYNPPILVKPGQRLVLAIVDDDPIVDAVQDELRASKR